MSDGLNKNWGLWTLANAAVSAWLIYDMSTAVEAPSQALAILQYIVLGLSLFALVGSVAMYLTRISRH
jgi:hypothetical protein